MREKLLVRHGQSRYNVKLTKDLDSELTEEGVRQVRETGRFLREHFAHIREFIGRTSPYHRCLQTAHILHEETGVDFWVEPGPREIMTCYDQCIVPSRHGEFGHFEWRAKVHTPHSDEGWTFHRETDEEFTKRILAYNEFLEGFDRVLVVSHGTPATSLCQMATGKYSGPSVTEYVSNSSISYVRNGELVWFNKVVYEQEAPPVDGHNNLRVEV